MATDITADIINGCVAIGTIAMAVYTRRTVNAAKKSLDDTNRALEAANRTAKATEDNAERMKDALMPHLNLSVRIEPVIQHDGVVTDDAAFLLTVRNSGAGPGIIREFTHREDLIPVRRWEVVEMSRHAQRQFKLEQMIDLTIGPQDEYCFRLKYKRERYSDTEEFLSSLSLFYEDVYGRPFRTRLIYVFHAQNGEKKSLPLNREYSKVERIPDISEAGDTDKIEGGRPVIYNPFFQQLHQLLCTSKKIGVNVAGTKITGGRAVEIERITVGDDGYPVFQLKIHGSTEFILETYRRGNDVRRVRVLDVALSAPQDFQYYGLTPASTDDNKSLFGLYRNVCGVCLDIEPDKIPGALFI